VPQSEIYEEIRQTDKQRTVLKGEVPPKVTSYSQSKAMLSKAIPEANTSFQTVDKHSYSAVTTRSILSSWHYETSGASTLVMMRKESYQKVKVERTR
jgi:hypothetical protein